VVHWRTAALAALGMVSAASGMASLAGTAAPASLLHQMRASGSTVTVPVRVIGGQGTATGARPTVVVQVGHARPVPVLLDTGSSGLRIFDTAVPSGSESGVTRTSQATRITYAGGHRFTGVVARAVITIGSQRTAQPVPFGLVQQISCVSRKPRCPAAGGMAGFQRYGGYGILGIGTESSGDGIVSPLLAMPGSLGGSWSLHLTGVSGQLLLGAPIPPPSQVAATMAMRPMGSSGGHPLWADDRLPLCVTAGAAEGCGPALLDSGTYTMQLSGSQFDQVPAASGKVTTGTGISVRVRGDPHPFWRFSAGTIKSGNLVTLEARSHFFVNTGVQAFYSFTVTYDDRHGTVRLVRPGIRD